MHEPISLDGRLLTLCFNMLEMCVWFSVLGDDLRVDLDLDFKSACFGVEEKVSSSHLCFRATRHQPRSRFVEARARVQQIRLNHEMDSPRETVAESRGGMFVADACAL